MDTTPLDTALAAEVTAEAATPQTLYQWREPTEEDLKGRYTTVLPEDVRRFMATLWADALGTWDNGDPSPINRGLVWMLMPKGGFTPEMKQTFVDEVTRINKGRAFYSSPDQLGRYLLVDYIEGKKKVI